MNCIFFLFLFVRWYSDYNVLFLQISYYQDVTVWCWRVSHFFVSSTLQRTRETNQAKAHHALLTVNIKHFPIHITGGNSPAARNAQNKESNFPHLFSQSLLIYGWITETWIRTLGLSSSSLRDQTLLSQFEVCIMYSNISCGESFVTSDENKIQFWRLKSC